MAILALAFLALVVRAFAISTIQAKGSKFFTGDGNQFYIKGIAYQLTEADPLADPDQCKLDSALMQKLGANSIRVYHVDANANHDECMSAFSDAGIYAWIDLDTTGTYILKNKPNAEPEWTQGQYHAYQRVMDAFHKYGNVAGFFVGNEMLNTGPDSVAAPYIKAAARDMKAYRDNKGYRDIPIGYSAADITALRPNLQNYLACGSNSSETVDFYSLNAYEWCGDSSYQQSGYDMLQMNATGYDIPIFMSETGCNKPEPRTFDDQSSIFGPNMAGTWSGAIIYEWIEETNNFGLISYGPPAGPDATGPGISGGYTRTGTPTPISPDFDNLSSQWATLSPKGVSENAYTPTATPPPCPSYTSNMWEVSGNVPLPTIGAKGTGYTTAPGFSTVKPGSGTSTSASSAASATRASSVGLGRRDLKNLCPALDRFRREHPICWSALCLLLGLVAFAIAV